MHKQKYGIYKLDRENVMNDQALSHSSLGTCILNLSLS